MGASSPMAEARPQPARAPNARRRNEPGRRRSESAKPWRRARGSAPAAAPGSRRATCSRMQTAPVTPSADQGSNGGTRRRLLGAAAIIALGNALSRALGLVRDMVIAWTFGATAGTDAFVLARTLPTILYDLLVGAVSTAAFVPVFVQHAR